MTYLTPAEREAESKTRTALLEATAAELGEGWTVDPTGWGGILIGPNGEHIEGSNTWDNNNGRLLLGALWPDLGDARRDDEKGTIVWGRASYRDSGRNSISVSLTRTAKAVASEIRRRLLPEYLEELPDRIAKAEGYLADYLEAEAFRAEIAETLAPLGGVDNTRQERIETHGLMGKRLRTEWEISHSLRYLKVEMSNLTPDQMRAVANLLATF